MLHQGHQHGFARAAIARVAQHDRDLRVQVQGVIDYGATESGVVVMAIPCVILFLLLQRYYIRGFMSGAVKG